MKRNIQVFLPVKQPHRHHHLLLRHLRTLQILPHQVRIIQAHLHQTPVHQVRIMMIIIIDLTTLHPVRQAVQVQTAQVLVQIQVHHR